MWIKVSAALVPLMISTSAFSATKFTSGTPRACANVGVPGSQSRLTPFNFKGVIAGTAVDMTKLKCGTPLRNGEMQCQWLDALPMMSTIGGVAIFQLSISIYQGRLSSVDYIVGAISYVRMAEALSAKYGTPCKIEHPQWQNRAGAIFDNTVMTWCFSSGNLTFV